MSKRFETIVLEEAFEFIQKQPLKSRMKIMQNIRRAEQGNDPKFFKKLNTEIWEFRTRYSGTQYRLLAFWDISERTMVIATHGFIKKTQRIEKKEIARAERIRKLYFKEKRK